MSFVRCLRFELMLFNIHISILIQPVQWWFVKLLFNYSWESMRLIISPLAPPTGQSFFIRPFIYLSRGGKKASKFSEIGRQFLSLSLCLHSKQSSEKINMHSESTAIVKLPLFQERPPWSVPLYHPNNWQGSFGPVLVDKPRAGSLDTTGFMFLCLPGCCGAAAARQGSLSLFFCQYRQLKLNKDVYWQPNERMGPGDLTLMNGPPRCFQ